VATPNTRLYRRFVAAFNAREIEQIISMMHPEIEFQSRFAQMGGAVYHGHEGVRGWLDDLADAWEYLDVDISEATEIEQDRAVSLIRLHGRGRASGLHIDEHLAH